MKRAILAVGCLIGLGSSAVAKPIVPDHHLPQIVGIPSDAQLSYSDEIDVPHRSWCYDAYDALGYTGLVGMRSGNGGNQPMTRYHFAIEIAHLLENLNAPRGIGLTQEADTALVKLVEKEAKSLSPYRTAQELADLIIALRREFAFETYQIMRKFADSDEWDLVYGKQ